MVRVAEDLPLGILTVRPHLLLFPPPSPSHAVAMRVLPFFPQIIRSLRAGNLEGRNYIRHDYVSHNFLQIIYSLRAGNLEGWGLLSVVTSWWAIGMSVGKVCYRP